MCPATVQCTYRILPQHQPISSFSLSYHSLFPIILSLLSLSLSYHSLSPIILSLLSFSLFYHSLSPIILSLLSFSLCYHFLSYCIIISLTSFYLLKFSLLLLYTVSILFLLFTLNTLLPLYTLLYPYPKGCPPLPYITMYTFVLLQGLYGKCSFSAYLRLLPPPSPSSP